MNDKQSCETEIALMQADISELKAQLTDVKTDVSETKTEVSSITERLVRIETLLETHHTSNEDSGRVISLTLKEVFLVLLAFVFIVLFVVGVDTSGIL